jgi:putative molybdopterin biosynthesis protein
MNTLDIAGGERLLTAGEIAKILNISRAKVYRLIQRGQIPSIRIHRLVRVMPADLREYAKRAHTGDFEA